VLRGLGASLALPLLDSMVPAMTALAQSAAAPVRRLGIVYLPNGMSMQYWTPASEGEAFQLTQILQPLAPFRDRLLVLSGFANKAADGRPGEGAGDHTRAQSVFLTGVHPKKTEGPDIRAGISVDQIAAAKFGQETQLASLELALEANDTMGSCDLGYSCAYQSTIAWRSATTPLPMETDPRAVFERLFGADSTDPRVRLARMRDSRSILDSVSDEIGRFKTGLGARDRLKLTEYLDAVRDIERRIQKTEEQGSRELPVVQQPAGVPPVFDDYAALMFDLMALAYQSDLTRVATFLVGRELSNRTYPEVGIPDMHHGLSHHRDDPGQLAKLARINTYHMKLFAKFIEKLSATPDGDGSLLDRSLILYGAGISDADKHAHNNLPIVLVGGGAGRGRHIRVAAETPLMNLHATVLDRIGIPIETLGDSTGRIEEIPAV
jgi:hypothetical protein